MLAQLGAVLAAALATYGGERLRRYREERRGADFSADLDPRSRRLLALTQWPTVLLALVVALPAWPRLPGAGWGLTAGGLGLAAGGLALRWWAILTLGRLFVGYVAVQSEHRVVQSGPYRWLRHPSYAGMYVAFAGLGLATGSLLSLLLCVLLPLPGLVRRILAEEAALSAALPAEYPAYARRTRRLVPLLW